MVQQKALAFAGLVQPHKASGERVLQRGAGSVLYLRRHLPHSQTPGPRKHGVRGHRGVLGHDLDGMEGHAVTLPRPSRNYIFSKAALSKVPRTYYYR